MLRKPGALGLTAALALLVGSACSGKSSSEPVGPAVAKHADLVLVGGDVWTLESGAPRAEAVAITGETISAVGTSDAIRALIGPETTVVELAGRSVTPGLVDSHAHLYGLGSALESVQLRGAKSAKDAARVAADALAGKPDGEWLTGRGWDQNLWSPAEFPTSVELDAVVGDRPVALRRVDGHALWASSAAIKIAGITSTTPDPSGGTIVRGKDGQPTGVFIDNAMSLVESKIPPVSKDGIRRRILRAAAAASAAGLTGVHEMGISAEVAAVYRELAEDGELPLRVYAFLSGAKVAFATEPQTNQTGAAWFTVRAFKLFADGALGSRGARLEKAYSDDPNNLGLWVTEPDELRKLIAEGTRRGWQIGVHAIGDAANREVLDAFEAALEGNDANLIRHRIEHAQVLRSEDIPRFASLGVIASMQPTHATSDMPWAEARVGSERIAGSYAWRTLLRAGARIAGGSDFPVEKVSPLLGVWSAATRQNEAGSPPGGWRAAEVMTLEEAIAAFSREGAYASFSENARGQIAVGRLADLTVYDSPLSLETLLQVSIAKTIVGGRVVYSSR